MSTELELGVYAPCVNLADKSKTYGVETMVEVMNYLAAYAPILGFGLVCLGLLFSFMASLGREALYNELQYYDPLNFFEKICAWVADKQHNFVPPLVFIGGFLMVVGFIVLLGEAL